MYSNNGTETRGCIAWIKNSQNRTVNSIAIQLADLENPHPQSFPSNWQRFSHVTKLANVLVKDVDWKSKASVTASYDFAICNKKMKFEPHIEVTSKPHITCQLPWIRCATNCFYFSRDNALCNASKFITNVPNNGLICFAGIFNLDRLLLTDPSSLAEVLVLLVLQMLQIIRRFGMTGGGE
jgi:hypothetical protein